MQISRQVRLGMLAAASTLIFAACGGGSTSAPEPAPAPAPDPLAPADLADLSTVQTAWEIDATGVGGDSAGDGGAGGAAGDGSPIKRASVVLTDANGKVYTGQTDDNGRYLIKFKTAEVKAPLVVKIVDAAGNVLASATEQTVPAGKVARSNISPFTDKVVSDVLGSTVAGTDKAYTGASVDTAKLATAKSNLTASIQSALATAGVASSAAFDPVRSIYKHDGTGVDAVLESVSHARDAASGATQLRAKLAPLTTNADGTVVPTLISASTPLATTLVALPTNPALTFNKITSWVSFLNTCLAAAAGTCGDAEVAKAISPAYKQNGKPLEEDFRTLLSESDTAGVRGSELRNPNILFIARYNGSTTDDLAVVEVTIRQPRTGPRAGNIATPIEYTKYLIFKRDDATAGLKAGNWILYGNQRAFDWSVEPRYFTFQQLNPANLVSRSRTMSSVRLSFSPTVYNPATGSNINAGVYAVRMKGPGLPASGVVYAPFGTSTGGFTILNKTGVIPAEGTVSTRAQADFRIAGVYHPSGGALAASDWPGGATTGNLPHYTDTQLTDFSALQAFSRYTVEIYKTGSTQPIVEQTTILAPVEAPSAYVQRPLHDLSPSAAIVTPPQGTATSVVAAWVRNPLAVRIDSAYFFSVASGVQSTTGANLPDANALTQTSTSITIPTTAAQAPAFSGTVRFDSREVGLTGRAARASFQQSVLWGVP